MTVCLALWAIWGWGSQNRFIVANAEGKQYYGIQVSICIWVCFLSLLPLSKRLKLKHCSNSIVQVCWEWEAYELAKRCPLSQPLGLRARWRTGPNLGSECPNKGQLILTQSTLICHISPSNMTEVWLSTLHSNLQCHSKHHTTRSCPNMSPPHVLQKTSGHFGVQRQPMF